MNQRLSNNLILNDLFRFHVLVVYIIISLFYFIISWLTNNYILNDNYYYSVLSDRQSIETITSLIGLSHRIALFSYCISPIILLFKLTLFASSVYASNYFFAEKLGFKQLFKLFIVAEFITIFLILIRFFIFLVKKPSLDQAIRNDYPLSILNFLDADDIPVYLLHSIQQFNFFELLYWIFCVTVIKTILNCSILKAFYIFFWGYGFLIIIWCLLFIFFQLQFS